jgi:hypothetical protein
MKQIQTENKKMITEIQQRHEIEKIELQDKMRQTQVWFIFMCHILYH